MVTCTETGTVLDLDGAEYFACLRELSRIGYLVDTQPELALFEALADDHLDTPSTPAL